MYIIKLIFHAMSDTKQTILKSLQWKLKSFYLLFILILISRVCLADIITVKPNTIIDKDTTFKNVILDFKQGSFIVKNNALLHIENSQIVGNISADNPFFILLETGKLIVKNNNFKVTANKISEEPTVPSLYYVFNIQQGNVFITENTFTINKPFTAGLLNTARFHTSQVNISNNRLYNFHGGIMLRNSDHAYIYNNRFSHVSSSNIFIIEGSNNLIKGNIIFFPGNGNVGDGIDIADSDSITLDENYISSGSCYSVLIWDSKNIVVNNNMINSGITYAVSVTTLGNMIDHNHDLIKLLMGKESATSFDNANYTITNNYFSQNRYGLAANDVAGLSVNNNTFIQRFSSNKNRKFWTNNDILLKGSTNVVWGNNLYKEAYTQEINGDNQKSAQFVLFPLHGGVDL